MKIWILFQSYKSKCLNSIFRVWNVAIYALFSGKFWYFGNCAGAKHLTSIMSEPCVRCAFCAVAVQSLFAAPHPPAQSSKPIGNTPQCPSYFSLNLCTFLQLHHLAKNLFLVLSPQTFWLEQIRHFSFLHIQRISNIMSPKLASNTNVIIWYKHTPEQKGTYIYLPECCPVSTLLYF